MRFRFAALLIVLAGSTAPAQQPSAPYEHTPSESQIEDLSQGLSLGAAEIARARPLNRVSLELIKAFEGWFPAAYDDPSKYCTIGYGHLIALDPCAKLDLVKIGFSESLSEEAGRALLFQDTTTARLAVMRLVQVALTADQFGALVSFAFNVGKGNLQKSGLLRVVNAGAFDQVPRELTKWVSSRGKVLKGLVARRNCEAELFAGRLKLNAKGQIDRNSCDGSLGAAPDIVIDIETGEQVSAQ